MNQREMDRCKSRLKKFINTSSDAEFDALVAEANAMNQPVATVDYPLKKAADRDSVAFICSPAV